VLTTFTSNVISSVAIERPVCTETWNSPAAWKKPLQSVQSDQSKIDEDRALSDERQKQNVNETTSPPHPLTLSPLPVASRTQGIPRAVAVDSLRRDSFDLLVIGGGITGAGIALDATLRGLRVANIDKGDFASGTSSASSKLIHGGLRYLEHGEFGLVHEALRERHILLRIAPHLVRPLRILVPQYAGLGRARWMVKLGLSLYDWLAGRERIGRHRQLDVAEVVAAAPGVRTDRLRGGFEFFDAQMDDARLCLEVVLTAVAAGAAAANYIEAVEIRHSRAGQACGCEVVDRTTGASFVIEARRIVNAAGPWLDEVNRIDDGAAPARLAPTKGVHIVLPSLGLDAGLLVTHPADGRVMFILPWMNRTLVGTTDTFFNDRPDDVGAAGNDVEYLLNAANHYFDQRFTGTDVLATMAGLRPLLRRNSKVPSAVSREFSIFQSKSGLWSIAGGKYTTYRSMAEELVDRVVAGLGESASARACRTAERPLIGCPSEDWSIFRRRELHRLTNDSGLDSQLAAHLLDRYGYRASSLISESRHDPNLWSPIVEGEREIWAELQFQAGHELAVCPADHLLRRTRLALFHPELLNANLKWPTSSDSDTLTA
jgi:glycerol-3-phosphate dehydrogenase